MEFNPGDVVRLKSGGPIMTVSSVGSTATKAKLGAQMVQCEWFNQVDKAFEVKSASFSVHSLRLFQNATPRTALSEG